MAGEHRLFSPLRINRAVFKNRIMMTPLYLGYANPDGTVSSYTPERLASSPVKTGDVLPQEMTQKDIKQVVRAFAADAGRARERREAFLKRVGEAP